VGACLFVDGLSQYDGEGLLQLVQGFGVHLERMSSLGDAQLDKAPLDDTLTYVFEAYARHFSDPLPVRTTVQAELMLDAKIEITVIAQERADGGE